MNKIAVTQNGEHTGMWFDADKAEVFSEDTYWNGSNHISKATGSQIEHEKLYLTKSGKWVLHSWSQWQGSRSTTEIIDANDAARWFARNEYADEDIPEVLHELIRELEI